MVLNLTKETVNAALKEFIERHKPLDLKIQALQAALIEEENSGDVENFSMDDITCNGDEK